MTKIRKQNYKATIQDSALLVDTSNYTQLYFSYTDGLYPKVYR